MDVDRFIVLIFISRVWSLMDLLVQYHGSISFFFWLNFIFFFEVCVGFLMDGIEGAVVSDIGIGAEKGIAWTDVADGNAVDACSSTM